MKKAVLQSLFILLPFISLNAGIAGSYSVAGFDPSVHQPYTGTLEIVQNGETYTGNWTFNDGTHETGTGIRKDDQLSFVFQGVEDPTGDIGVQVYELRHDHDKGPWANLGSSVTGFESIKKIEQSH